LAILPAKAQFIGYTSPQTVSLSRTVSCPAGNTGVSVIVPNLGQSNHVVNFASVGGTALDVWLEGTDSLSDAVLNFPISPFSFSNAGAVQASGYYNIVIIQITCKASDTVQLFYAGTSGPGASVPTLPYDALLSFNLAATTGQTWFVAPPSGHTGGILSFTPIGTGSSGATVTIRDQLQGHSNLVFTTTLATTTGVQQIFQIPDGLQTGNVEIDYVAGGASTATYTLDYLFTSPTSAGAYQHITGTTAVEVKSAAGTLTNVVVNTPAAGTLSLFDLPVASCTGTPSTNVVAVITPNATDAPHSIPYSAYFNNGICVKASVAMDLTVVYQ
jgi:hypothetical protein